MSDFTYNEYQILLKELINSGCLFLSFQNYVGGLKKNVILLRHDVDLKPQNSLATAIIENKLGILGTYYFRMVPESFNVDIIRQIADLGHEVGYHYETMDTASVKLKVKSEKLKEEEIEKLIDVAYEDFCENLEEFRKIYPVKTICMHGSPKSAFDNRDIWKKYDYRQLGIIGEPYFDIDFDKFFYLTDTGRCWNGYKYSVRDKMPQQERWVKEGLVFKTTNDIIKAAQDNKLPNQIMITVHPQRWTNKPALWLWELAAQRAKNVVKAFRISSLARQQA
ncbi:MAG TPA: hypothetical protein PKN78_08455, partial [Tenuifilaceae bacterium]|nr:hypothetical protein [Tenuifilaceae bacterium]